MRLYNLLLKLAQAFSNGWISLDTSAVSGVDHDLTQKLTTLGWLDDVTE